MRSFRTIRKVSWAEDFFKAVKKALQSDIVTVYKPSFLAFLVGFLLLLSVLFGSSRRHSKSAALKAVLWASYTMMTQLIAYTLSFIRRPSSDKSLDEALWPMVLLIAFGSADSFSAYSLLDCEQWKRYNWQFVLKLWTTFAICYEFSVTEGSNIVMILLIFLLAVLPKMHMKTQSLASSSLSSLGKNGKLIAEYMRSEQEETDIREIDPATMKGYKYLVSGEETRKPRMKNRRFDVTDERVVTLEKVWNCDGKLLSSGHGDRLKDLCISFSFFKFLRIKYAGYKLPPEVHEKIWRLIRHGLLHSEENGPERLFRVVEEELAFLFDLFYTKRPLIFQPYRLWMRSAEFLVIGAMSSFTIYVISRWGMVSIPMIVTLMTYLVAESVQFLVLLFTTWMKVMVTCKYVTHGSWQTSKVMEKCIGLICSLPSLKPWERKLHQYSLLESYMYDPCKLFSNGLASMFINWNRSGQKENDPIDLSGEVKKAAFDCLKNLNGSVLENGDASLRLHGVSSELSWACRLETQTEVVMVWHIATTMCESRASMLYPSEMGRNFRVAIGLSKYLAYLVAFTPRLLPDHPYVTVLSFDNMVREARCLLNGCKTVQERVDKLIAGLPESACNTTLARGATLGKQLLDHVGEPAIIWEVLVDFWAETMLYVAPSEDARAHVEQLSNGGEFVTHLWALVDHIGIKRMKYPRPSHRRMVVKPRAHNGED